VPVSCHTFLKIAVSILIASLRRARLPCDGAKFASQVDPDRTGCSTVTYLEELYRRSPEIAATATARAAHEFFRHRSISRLYQWPSWLQSAKGTALASFARCTLVAADRSSLLS
jgi:hypothetical protein